MAWQAVLEEALAAQVLPIAIFDPQRNDFFVGMAKGVFQIMQPCNQPSRQRRRAPLLSVKNSPNAVSKAFQSTFPASRTSSWRGFSKSASAISWRFGSIGSNNCKKLTGTLSVSCSCYPIYRLVSIILSVGCVIFRGDYVMDLQDLGYIPTNLKVNYACRTVAVNPWPDTLVVPKPCQPCAGISRNGKN